MNQKIILLLATIVLGQFLVNGERGNDDNHRQLRERLSDGRGGAAGASKNREPQVRRTLPPISIPTISPEPTAPTSNPTKEPTKNPTESPTNGNSCNICSVPGATITRPSRTASFNGNQITCSDFQNNANSGMISESECPAAQDAAVANCGCSVGASLAHKNPVTCSDVQLSGENLQWLEAHNSRREFWHKYHGADYEPVCWDSTLAAQAQFYAEHLADNCVVAHDTSKPDPNGYEYCRQAGENLGFSSSSTPNSQTPFDIVLSWTDGEFNDSYPSDLHMTQVLWRPTKYIGCGRAFNSNCYWKNVVVCRYVKYGNCNCAGDCRDDMLFDTSLCGPDEVEQTLDDYTTCFNNWNS